MLKQSEDDSVVKFWKEEAEKAKKEVAKLEGEMAACKKTLEDTLKDLHFQGKANQTLKQKVEEVVETLRLTSERLDAAHASMAACTELLAKPLSKLNFTVDPGTKSNPAKPLLEQQLTCVLRDYNKVRFR